MFEKGEMAEWFKCCVCKSNCGNIMSHGHAHSDTPIQTDFYINYCTDCYDNRRAECDAETNRLIEEGTDRMRRYLEEVLASDEYDSNDLRNRTIRHFFLYNFQSIEDYEREMKIKMPEAFKQKISDLCCTECGRWIKPIPIKWQHPPINYWPEKLPDGGKEYRETSARWTKDHTALYWGYVDRTPQPEFPEKHMKTKFDEYKDHPDLMEYYASVRKWYTDRNHFKLCSEECLNKVKEREPEFKRLIW